MSTLEPSVQPTSRPVVGVFRFRVMVVPVVAVSIVIDASLTQL